MHAPSVKQRGCAKCIVWRTAPPTNPNPASPGPQMRRSAPILAVWGVAQERPGAHRPPERDNAAQRTNRSAPKLDPSPFHPSRFIRQRTICCAGSPLMFLREPPGELGAAFRWALTRTRSPGLPCREQDIMPPARSRSADRSALPGRRDRRKTIEPPHLRRYAEPIRRHAILQRRSG